MGVKQESGHLRCRFSYLSLAIFSESSSPRLKSATHSICVKLLHKHDKLTQCCRAFTLALARLSCSRRRPSATLELFSAFLDHPQSIFGGLYWCAKFHRNPCSSVNNMKVWIFHAFGLKMPIHAQKLWFWGCDPLSREIYQQNPQKAHTYVERRHMTIQTVKIGPPVRVQPRDEETKNTKNLTVAKWVFTQTTHVEESKYRLVVFWQ